MNFDDNELRRLDLTLLLVFEAAMAGGKLSAAARRLSLTQSAISHALKRLRDIFDDELFIRTPRGVSPTPRALALRAPLAEALRLINAALHPSAFDPTDDDRVFRIAASDFETSVFAPLLLSAVSGPATPRLIFQPMVRRDAIEALQAGDVDLLLGYHAGRLPNSDAVILFDENYLVVARKGHPLFDRPVGKPLDIARYASAAHVLVAPGGSLVGIVDKALAEIGLTRRVAIAVPYFLAALATVARSDMIATLPSRVAVTHADGFGLDMAPPPISIRSFPVSMIWNRRTGGDPAQAWLRDEVRRAASILAPLRPSLVTAAIAE